MKKYLLLITGTLLALWTSACGVQATPQGTSASTAVTLRLVTHDSFNFSQSVLDTFQRQTGITVEVLRSGDAGTMVNQLVLSKDNPLGDVTFGVDNTFLGRALNADLFLPYESPLLANVADDFKLDTQHRVTPIDYGDVCLNYDVAYFADGGLPLPANLRDLTDARYRGLLVVQNPAVSSPGLAFLLATVGVFGTEGAYSYLDFWRDLKANDVLVADDWSSAYYTHFTVPSEDGTRPLVVSYASSPPAEVIFATPTPDSAPTGSIVADGTCFRQIEFAGILRGTAHPAEAQQLIDFLLSVPFQEDMPLNMFVFPVNNAAALPDAFAQYASVPANPVQMDYTQIDANRERWIEGWAEVMLR